MDWVNQIRGVPFALAQIEDTVGGLVSSLDNPVVAAMAGMVLTVIILVLIYKIVGSDKDDTDILKVMAQTLNTVMIDMAKSQQKQADTMERFVTLLGQQAESGRMRDEGIKERNKITMEMINEHQKEAVRIVTNIHEAHSETQQVITRHMDSINAALSNVQKLASEIPLTAREEFRKEAEELRKSFEALILKAYTISNDSAGESITDTNKPVDQMTTPGKRLRPPSDPAHSESAATEGDAATQEEKTDGSQTHNRGS